MAETNRSGRIITTAQDPPDPAYGDRVMRKVIRHLLPFILVMYIVNYIDRVNLGFAALTMNPDLGITPVVFGLVSGVFFIGYVFFEYPSNRMMERFGARIWIPRILLPWGIVVVLLALAGSAFDVGVLRFLLGLAEAGFYPGIVFYLSLWLREKDLATCMSYLFAAQIIAVIIGAPISTFILDNVTWAGLASWRWLFILEGIPAILLGGIAYLYLTDRPEDAAWLDADERAWLVTTVTAERESHGIPEKRTVAYFFRQLSFNRLWIAFFFEMCAGYAIVFWLPQIVHSFRFDISHTGVGFITAVPYAGALVVMLLWARHSDTTGERKVHLILPWTAAAAGLIGAACVTDPAQSLMFLTLTAIGLYSGVPVFWALVTERMRRIDGSGGIALVNALGTLGGFAGPFLLGFFVAGDGGMHIGPALLIFGGFMLVSVLLMLWDFRDRNNGMHTVIPEKAVPAAETGAE
jgi:ACS family tartrate transporter-like MFS transporter